MTPITKQQVEELIDRLAGKEQEVLYRCNRVWEAWQIGTMTEEDFEEVVPPILLSDVLEKMSKQDKVFELREVCKFLEAWEMCVTEEERAQGKTGFTKSLQEIALFVDGDVNKAHNKHARDLFDFLTTLFNDAKRES